MPRVKNYNREEMLDKAMELFWEKGYAATSMQSLVDHLGINRFSIYDSFGDKHSLFLAALDRYREIVAESLRTKLNNDTKGIEAIKDYFRAMAADLSTPSGRMGCLVQNSTLEMVLSDPEVEKRIEETNLSFRKGIHDALVRAQKMGEIEPTDDTPQKAQLLFSTGQGMIVTGKAHGDPKMVQDVCDQVCSLLDSW